MHPDKFQFLPYPTSLPLKLFHGIAMIGLHVFFFFFFELNHSPCFLAEGLPSPL